MGNLDNQPGREDRAGFGNRTPNSRTDLFDYRRTGMGRGTIGAIVAAVVIIGALMLFGPWGHNRTADNNSPPRHTQLDPSHDDRPDFSDRYACRAHHDSCGPCNYTITEALGPAVTWSGLPFGKTDGRRFCPRERNACGGALRGPARGRPTVRSQTSRYRRSIRSTVEGSRESYLPIRDFAAHRRKHQITVRCLRRGSSRRASERQLLI